MAAGGTASNVVLGPGRLWVAAIGTTEPASASAALPSANWHVVGYTEEGNAFRSETTTEAVEVAEELDPIRYVNTRRIASIQFSMAEVTRRNLALALNVGAGQPNTAGQFNPPDLGAEVRVMIVWDKNDTLDDTNVRWLFRQCYQVDPIEMPHRKAPAKALLPVRFQLEKPDAAASYTVFPNVTGLVG